jgi:hypothetical protein
MSRTPLSSKRKYTVWVRCSIRGTIGEYKMTGTSKSAVCRFYRGKRDTLIWVCPGWGNFALWALDLLGIPLHQRTMLEYDKRWFWDFPPFDWREEEDFF